MKIQCSCGTKIAFDITPDMAQNPVRFVCPKCGLDSSAMVNEMIRRELAGNAASPAAAPPENVPTAIPVAEVATAKPVAPAKPGIRLAETSPTETPAAETQRFCPRHYGYRPVDRCRVCQKPICQKCMEIFGYVCSAHCKNKAELQGIEIPVFKGQKSVVERQQWRKVNLIAGSIAACFAVALGAWVWYHFFASRPGVIYAAKFDQSAESGQSVLLPDNQLIVLHGGTLERHDIKLKKRFWSLDLVDHKAVANAAAASLRHMAAQRDQTIDRTGEGYDIRLPSLEKLTAQMEDSTDAALQLYVAGHNIWVSSPQELVRHDWDSGNAAQEIKIAPDGGVIPQGDELVVASLNDSGQEAVVHVNLLTGATTPEAIEGTVAALKPAAAPPTLKQPNLINPEKVAANVNRMTYAQKLALPATLSVRRNQQQLLDEMRSEDGVKPAAATPKTTLPPEHVENATILPSANGDIQFSVMLLERRIVTREAMKAPPKKSALNGNVNVTQTKEFANEILNDMQRQRGADTVQEDDSRYLVTIRRPGTPDAQEWKGEVVGPPSLYPLKTVTVLAAGKTIITFDKFNKKLWESALAFPMPEDRELFVRDDPTTGLGPCVERGDTLYVFDQGVLSAFNLVTGDARWRLPSVGISGLFFDDQGMLYANSTTASHEKIKYSHQIDIGESIQSVLLKIDPKNGKTLWAQTPGGAICYFSGQYIYTLESNVAENQDEQDSGDNIYSLTTVSSYMRLRRINPKNGTVMWEYYQKRAPLDIHFDKNTFLIVFKKEVQVLHYLSL